MTHNGFLDKMTEMLADVLFTMCTMSSNHSFGYTELYTQLRRANEKGVFGEVPPIMTFEFESVLVKLQELECLTWRDKDCIDADFDKLKCVVLAFKQMKSSKQVSEFID